MAWPLPLTGAERGSAARGSTADVDVTLAAWTAPEPGIARGDALQEDAMTALVNFINTVSRNEEGQDLLEYALLVALIALVAVGAVTAAGLQVNTIFNQIATAI